MSSTTTYPDRVTHPVHVTLPPFSRLCLLCSRPSADQQLSALLRQPGSSRRALRRLLPLLHRRETLLYHTCRRCRALVTTWESRLDALRAAARRVVSAYRAGEAARAGMCVTLRRGQDMERVVTLDECCRLVEGELGQLVTRLVTDTYGAGAAVGTIVVDRQLTNSDRRTEAWRDGHLSRHEQSATVILTPSSATSMAASQEGASPGVIKPETSTAVETSSISPKLVNRSEATAAPKTSNTSSESTVDLRVNTTVTSRSLSDTAEASQNQPAVSTRQLRRRNGKSAENTESLQSDYSSDEGGEGLVSAGAGGGRRRTRRRAGRGDFELAGMEIRGARATRHHARMMSGTVRDRPAAAAATSFSCDVCGHYFRTEGTLRAHVGRLHANAGCQQDTLSSGERHSAKRNVTISGHISVESPQEDVSHLTSGESREGLGPSGDPTYGLNTRCDPVSAVYDDLVVQLRSRARRQQSSLQGITEVTCPFCSQSCSLHYLRTHLYKHRAAGFRCHQCGKVFKFPASYQKHLLLHAGRAEKCPHCDALFTGRSNLRSHLQTHTVEKQFACDHCAKRFKFKQTRDAHVARAHGGGAARVCHVCGAQFRLQYQLTVHLARHVNSRALACPLCGKLYQLNLDLKRHLYSKHRLRVSEVARRFPEIACRPNTVLDTPSALVETPPAPGYMKAAAVSPSTCAARSGQAESAQGPAAGSGGGPPADSPSESGHLVPLSDGTHHVIPACAAFIQRQGSYRLATKKLPYENSHSNPPTTHLGADMVSATSCSANIVAEEQPRSVLRTPSTACAAALQAYSAAQVAPAGPIQPATSSPGERLPDSRHTPQEGRTSVNEQLISAAAEPRRRTEAEQMGQLPLQNTSEVQRQLGSPAVAGTQLGSPAVAGTQLGSPVVAGTQLGSPSVAVTDVGSAAPTVPAPSVPSVVAGQSPLESSPGAGVVSASRQEGTPSVLLVMGGGDVRLVLHQLPAADDASTALS